MAECDNVLQIQSRMAHLNTTEPPIHITEAQLHGLKYSIQFYQHLLLNNHNITQHTGQNLDI